MREHNALILSADAYGAFKKEEKLNLLVLPITELERYTCDEKNCEDKIKNAVLLLYKERGKNGHECEEVDYIISSKTNKIYICDSRQIHQLAFEYLMNEINEHDAFLEDLQKHNVCKSK